MIRPCRSVTLSALERLGILSSQIRGMKWMHQMLDRKGANNFFEKAYDLRNIGFLFLVGLEVLWRVIWKSL